MLKSAVFVAGGCRTPIGSLGGALSLVRADDLAAHALRGVLARYPSVDAQRITDVIWGAANQAGEDNRNLARMALLLAGLAPAIPGFTVNRLCASGLTAAVAAAQAIAAGSGELFLAGGSEHMTRAPYVLSKSGQAFGRDAELFDTSLGWRFVNPALREKYGVDSMGQTAENVAELLDISRTDQDAFALGSQLKAAEARRRGRFAREILPITAPGIGRGKAPVVTEHDEFIRPETTLEKLANLRPVFRNDGKGSVTAGNSSGLNDGACALLIASEQALKEHGLEPLARIVASSVVGVEPRTMGLGPVPATRRVLQLARLELKDVSIIELNEAFAAQSLGCLRELGLADDDPRVNPNGGAIALGHPLGMSGARLVLTAAHELVLRGERYALCTMCIGVGQGIAVLLERASSSPEGATPSTLPAQP